MFSPLSPPLVRAITSRTRLPSPTTTLASCVAHPSLSHVPHLPLRKLLSTTPTPTPTPLPHVCLPILLSLPSPITRVHAACFPSPHPVDPQTLSPLQAAPTAGLLWPAHHAHHQRDVRRQACTLCDAVCHRHAHNASKNGHSQRWVDFRAMPVPGVHRPRQWRPLLLIHPGRPVQVAVHLRRVL